MKLCNHRDALQVKSQRVPEKLEVVSGGSGLKPLLIILSKLGLLQFLRTILCH